MKSNNLFKSNHEHRSLPPLPPSVRVKNVGR